MANVNEQGKVVREKTMVEIGPVAELLFTRLSEVEAKNGKILFLESYVNDVVISAITARSETLRRTRETKKLSSYNEWRQMFPEATHEEVAVAERKFGIGGTRDLDSAPTQRLEMKVKLATKNLSAS